MSSPIFILGNPRSGTTLLRLMLNNHSNIIIPPECGFAVWFYEQYANIPITETVIRGFLLDLRSARKIETWKLDFDELEKYLRLANLNSYSQLVSLVYEFYGHSVGKQFQRWGDKNNFYIQHVDTIKKMFPSSCLVHIVRDGRDVACSYKALNRSNIESKYAPHLPDQIAEIAVEWTANVSCAINSFEKIGWKNVYEVRYEDLTSQPTTELEKLCDFLGEPYDQEMQLYFLKNQTEQQEPVEFLQWKQKTLERPTTSEVGKYLTELTQAEIDSFNEIASPLLKKYRYIA